MDGISPVSSIQGVQTLDPAAQGGIAPNGKQPVESVARAAVKTSAKDFVVKMQTLLGNTDVSIGFAKYGANKTAVLIYSKQTGEVIREIPAKEIQQLQSRMDEMIGMIFNHMV